MNQDFKDLLSQLNAVNARYLIVGAHALAAHGHVRATKDLDIWTEPSEHNAKLVFQALAGFGAPLKGVSVEDFMDPLIVFQMGVAPIRIDIVAAIDGVDFNEAWARRMDIEVGGETVHVLSREDVITNKLSTGRLQDLADVDALQRLSDPDA